MNKIKLLYGITRILKNEDQLRGTLQAKVSKDREEVFTLRNEFTKNGQGKAKTVVSAELNLDGRHVTRESVTEFDLQEGCGHGPGLLRRFIHGHGKRGAQHCCGVRGFFGRLSAFFGLLNGIEVQEKENGAARLVLNLDALPDEVKAGLLEKMRHKAAHCCGHGFPGQCHELEEIEGRLNIEVDKEHRIENITLDLTGSLRDEESGVHPVTAWGEVQFSW